VYVVAKFLEPNRKTNCSSLLKIIQTIFAGESNKVGIFFLVLKRKLGFLKRSCFSTMDAAIFTSVYVCNIPKTKKAFFNLNPPALSSSSCWLCNSQAKQIIKLRIREGSNQGLLRVHALFNNEEASSESEDKNGFGLLPADIFSLPQVNEVIKKLLFSNLYVGLWCCMQIKSFQLMKKAWTCA